MINHINPHPLLLGFNTMVSILFFHDPSLVFATAFAPAVLYLEKHSSFESQNTHIHGLESPL